MAFRRLALLLSTSFIAAGCLMFAPHEEGTVARKGIGLKEAVSNLTAEDRAIIKGRNEFAVRLAQAMNLGADGKNACVSPISVDQTMAILLNGAQGATFETCAKVMGLVNPRADKLNVSNSRLLDVLASQPGQPLLIANSLWNVFPTRFDKQYQADMAMFYDANIQKLGSAGMGAKKQINDWVADKTKGRIKTLFEKLDPEALAMVVNIVRFEGEWEQPFAPAKDENFETPSGPKSVPMIHGSGLPSSSLQGIGFDALTLPYKDNSVAMSLVLPSKGASPDTILNLQTMRQVMESSVKSSSDATFPKFKFTTKTDMTGAIGSMGGKQLFASENDFSLMSHEMKSGVAVSQFVHIVQIETDEKGTRATAATGVESSGGVDTPSKFVADRPFLFFVWEKNTETILFIGVVNDPSQ